MGRTAEFKHVPSPMLKNGLTETIESQLAQARMSELDKLNLTLCRYS